MIGLNKNQVFVNLKDKSEECLADLYNFLIYNGEIVHRNLGYFTFYAEEDCDNFLVGFCTISNKWMTSYKDKTEVSIEELKNLILGI